MVEERGCAVKLAGLGGHAWGGSGRVLLTGHGLEQVTQEPCLRGPPLRDAGTAVPRCAALWQLVDEHAEPSDVEPAAPQVCEVDVIVALEVSLYLVAVVAK